MEIVSPDNFCIDGNPLLSGVSETNRRITAVPIKPPIAAIINPYYHPNAPTMTPVIINDKNSPM